MSLLSVHLNSPATLFRVPGTGLSYLLLGGAPMPDYRWDNICWGLEQVGVTRQGRAFGRRWGSTRKAAYSLIHPFPAGAIDDEAHFEAAASLREAMHFEPDTMIRSDQRTCALLLHSRTWLENRSDGSCVWHVETAASKEKLRKARAMLHREGVATKRRVRARLPRGPIVVPVPATRPTVRACARAAVPAAAAFLVLAGLFALALLTGTGGAAWVVVTALTLLSGAVAGSALVCAAAVRHGARMASGPGHVADLFLLGKVLDSLDGRTAIKRSEVLWEAAQDPAVAATLLEDAFGLARVLDEAAVMEGRYGVQHEVLARATEDIAAQVQARLDALADAAKVDRIASV